MFFDRYFCKHKHSHLEGNDLVCNNCGDSHTLSAIFTQPTGVFLRIEQRIEDEREYNSLIKLAEEYQSDREFNHGN